MTDAEIVARLRERSKLMEAGEDYWPDTVDALDEAADLIERQAARIAELDGVARELLSFVESDYIGSRGKDYSNGAIGRARAALEKP